MYTKGESCSGIRGLSVLESRIIDLGTPIFRAVLVMRE